MVLRILISWTLVRFCQNLRLFSIFQIFLSFSEFNYPYWTTKLFKSWRRVTWHNSRDKEFFWTFSLWNLEAFKILQYCKFLIPAFYLIYLSIVGTFSLRNLEVFLLNFAIFCIFLNISFLFDLFTSRARKLKVAVSNRAKASLTKPRLATDEANRSPVGWEQFVLL